MTLLSLKFYIILAAAALIYYTAGRRWQWGMLLLMSLAFFLAFGTPYTIVYLLVSIASTYTASMVIGSGKTSRKSKKAALVIAILVNIGILAALKYLNAFMSGISAAVSIFGTKINFEATNFAASIGISFYTFQIIGYLCDVYWEVSEVQKNPLKLALFAGYFPQMISGPISRYSQLKEQLYKKHTFDYKAVTFGLQRILWGVFKKLVIAERIALFVNTVFGAHTMYKEYAALAALSFTIQLYADFSGSMDIILGISECFGIKLPENFKNPFASRTVQEFWQRWHITLGTWFKDYVMFPVLKSGLWRKMGKSLKSSIGKSSAGKAASRMIPSFLGMLVLWVGIGVWHGGGLQFVFQGLWFWLVIVLGQITAPMFLRLRTRIISFRTPSKPIRLLWHLFQKIRTALLFSVGLLFFRADNLNDALAILKNALTGFSPSLVLSSNTIELMGNRENIIIIISGVLIMLVTGCSCCRGIDIRKPVAGQNIAVRWAAYLALIFAVILFGMYGSGYNPADFIYGGF